MLRLLFQTFINCSSKSAWNSSRWCSTRWAVLSLVLQPPAKYLLIGRSSDTLPLFAALCLPFLLQVFTTQVLDSIENGSRLDNPTLHLTFIHFVPFRVLAPWLSLTKNIMQSKLQRWTRDPSLTVQGRRHSLKWFCCCPGAGPSPQPWGSIPVPTPS